MLPFRVQQHQLLPRLLFNLEIPTKKILSFVAGVAFVVIATIVPAMAQNGTDSATSTVGVTNFIEFAISNTGTCSASAAFGTCPFGNAGLVSFVNTAGAVSAASNANTTFTLRTNNYTGLKVQAYATNTGNANNCLDNATDFIADSYTDLAAAQAANVATDPATGITGLAFRLLDTGTDIAYRGADEDTQWGAGDVNGTDALWASFPISSGNSAIIFDSEAPNTVSANAIVTYYAGVPSTQDSGTYACSITYDAYYNA